MSNSSAQRRIQSKAEAAFGTTLAATAVLGGITDFGWKSNIAMSQRRYLQGDFSPAHNIVKIGETASLTAQGDLVIEDFGIWCNMFMADTITGAGPFVHTFGFPRSTWGAPKSRTLEVHDGNQEYEFGGCLLDSLSISAGIGGDGVTQFQSSVIGISTLKSTLTPAINPRVVTPLPSANWVLTIDDLAGTIGTTTKTDTLISWAWKLDTGLHMKTFQNGAYVPTQFGYSPPSISLDLVLEATANGIIEIDKYLAATGRLIRLKNTVGTQIAQLDFAGNIVSLDAWDDRDGNTTIKLHLETQLDETNSTYGQAVSTTTLSPLPDA